MPAISPIDCFASQLNDHIDKAIQYRVRHVDVAREIRYLVYIIAHPRLKAGLPAFPLAINKLQKAIDCFGENRRDCEVARSSLYHNIRGKRVCIRAWNAQVFNTEITGKLERRRGVQKSVKGP